MIKVSDKTEKIEGIPALLYAALWQTREMGFLEKILTDLKVNTLRIIVFFDDYKPGAFLEFDREKGDYNITAINSIEEIKYDGAIIGKLEPVLKTLEGNIYLRGLKVLFKRQIVFKGKLKLFKFLKILMRCAI